MAARAGAIACRAGDACNRRQRAARCLRAAAGHIYPSHGQTSIRQAIVVAGYFPKLTHGVQAVWTAINACQVVETSSPRVWRCPQPNGGKTRDPANDAEQH